MIPRLLAPIAAASGLLAAGCGSSPSSPPASTAAGTPAAVTTATVGTGPSATAPAAQGSPAVEVNPAGDIPDNQVYVAYSLPSGAFGVRVPEGWARAGSGSAVTFTDHYNSIRLETVAAPAAPTVDSARQTELPAIRQQAAGVTSEAVSTVTRTAGAAVLITYQATSAPNPVTGRVARLAVERYEFWRNGSEAILTLSAPVGSDNVDPWKTVTNGFRWL
ncbi:MAG TPA: hypothetical protein VGP96_00880 [Candidatus Dormibacteraeota bacterium]|jgi:hypothetical protein|nr:hypothetical protein [Candidatus Dormibacteraeota bacterium]